jgi:hypothetical protein
MVLTIEVVALLGKRGLFRKYGCINYTITV